MFKKDPRPTKIFEKERREKERREKDTMMLLQDNSFWILLSKEGSSLTFLPPLFLIESLVVLLVKLLFMKCC